MSSASPHPDVPNADAVPETNTGGVTADAPTYEGTLQQDSPPTWVSGGASASLPSGSLVTRSGKEIHALDREIGKSINADGPDAAPGYLLLRNLGTGAFGTVWEAEDRVTSERIAIKFFTSGDSDWEKLLGEVRLLQAVEGCRGIIVVKQVRPGSEGCRPHYVMQLANSGSLASRIKAAQAMRESTGNTPKPRDRKPLLPMPELVRIFTRIVDAMATVHRRGIHHCDLKPPNVLLHSPEPGAAPEPLVADFGQGHLATDDTPALGTLFYMPPDQVADTEVGTPPDTRWDVYALGAVAYEMIVGEPPRRTADLLERLRNAPKTLAGKMQAYREGVLAAPSPTGHHGRIDRQLAQIIDRCLDLDPTKRPQDAGDLSTLLNARARWRRTRPILGFAALATFALIAFLATAGLWFATQVTEDAKRNASADIEGSLARTAWYGTRAVENELQTRIALIEKWANDPSAESKEVFGAIGEASRRPQGPLLDPAAAPPTAIIRAWLTKLHTNQMLLTGHEPSTITLIMVSNPETRGPTNPPDAVRGFVLARLHPNGSVEDRDQPDPRGLYQKDFSYRDYFSAAGDRVDEAGRPHTPIRFTHISQPYRSIAPERSGKGTLERPWRIDLATPIWDDPASPNRRTIGHLRVGLNVRDTLAPLLRPPLVAEDGTPNASRFGIAVATKVILVDNSQRWVWHPDCERLLTDAEDSAARLPPTYTELARERGGDVSDWCPWLRPHTGIHQNEFVRANQYADLVRTAATGEDSDEIACFTRFDPYRLSRYNRGIIPGSPPPREWVFIVEVDRKLALQPLEELQSKIVKIGSVVVTVLAALAVALWIGLVWVLRRLEFASHG